MIKKKLHTFIDCDSDDIWSDEPLEVNIMTTVTMFHAMSEQLECVRANTRD
jgi:hypothetical protein